MLRNGLTLGLVAALFGVGCGADGASAPSTAETEALIGGPRIIGVERDDHLGDDAEDEDDDDQEQCKERRRARHRHHDHDGDVERDHEREWDRNHDQDEDVDCDSDEDSEDEEYPSDEDEQDQDGDGDERIVDSDRDARDRGSRPSGGSSGPVIF